MLTNVWVHNFRSLENFGLEIEPGLNVLVGPNGAGKTSIMKWFEFLSLLSSLSLRESIGKVGGANHVFRRKDDKYSENLKFSFCGVTVVDDSFYYQKYAQKITSIDYEFEGEISVIKNQIFFSYQHTKIWIHNKRKLKNIKENKPNIDISWKYDALTDEVKSEINIEKPKNTKSGGMERYYFDERKVLEEIVRSRDSLEYLIIPHRYFPVDYLYSVKRDINYKKAFNINPNSVRSATDISLQPGVQFDGSGLVSTLYDIKSDNTHGARSRYNISGRSRASSRNVYSKVMSYFKLSDGAIQGISATIDNFRNEFNVEVEFEFSDGAYKVPVFLLSDGTLKWLAIVTALATEENSFFIEEPENFLHPRLQESIVEIIREEIGNSVNPRFAFLTTHSETLLNKLKPDEIIVTSMVDGKTISERVENPDELSNIIADSGFGLGYFYVSGGL